MAKSQANMALRKKELIKIIKSLEKIIEELREELEQSKKESLKIQISTTVGEVISQLVQRQSMTIIELKELLQKHNIEIPKSED